MALNKKSRPSAILGVQFRQDSIAVVEMRKSGSTHIVTAAGSAELAQGYLEPNAPGGTAYIGQKLRALLKEIGATAKNAMVAVPSHGTMTRLIELPPLPDDEMRMAIDGEIREHQMLTETGGAFDYSPIGEGTEQTKRTVLVMAADDIILWRLQDIIKTAGLRLHEFVPSHSAAMRSMLGDPLSEPTLHVSVGMSSCEMAIFDGTDCRMYRRIDVRGSDLVVQAASLDEEEEMAAESAGLHSGEIPFALKLAQEGRAEGIDPVIAARLTTELRRSLDYHNRQNPNEHPISRAKVVISDDRLSEVRERIGEDLGLDAQVGEATIVVQGSARLVLSGAPDVKGYAPAVGLALQNFGHAGDTLHAFTLAAAGRVVERTSNVRKTLVPTLVIAGFFALAGLGITMVLNATARILESENDALSRDLNALKAEYLPIQEAAQLEMTAMGELAIRGIPFPPIMDQISGAQHGDLWLTKSTFDVGGRISLQGEARNEAAIISTLNRLRMSGGFYETYLDRFDQRQNKGIQFSISSRYDLQNPARIAIESIGDDPMGDELVRNDLEDTEVTE